MTLQILKKIKPDKNIQSLIPTSNILIILLSSLMIIIEPLNAQTASEDVLKAYELRMEGKRNDAITILNAQLERDPKNAMAHYEMSRALDNDQKSYHLDKALSLDPDNLKYRFDKANMEMLSAYIGMKSNNIEAIKENLEKCTNTLKSILEIKPDCSASLLFLIDIYGSVPEDMGGNIELAYNYLSTLEKTNPFYAAKGEAILASHDDSFDLVAHWHNYIDEYGETNEALIQLGKVQLLNGDISKATESFKKVISKDASQNHLYLDIARAHLYKAMQNEKQRNSHLKKLKKNINKYLEIEPNKPVIIEAWCYGWLSRAEVFMGNEENAGKYHRIAESLYPEYPKSTGLPKVDGPPNELSYAYKSYFKPF